MAKFLKSGSFFLFISFFLFTSCDSFNKKAGTFSVSFSWAKDTEGKEIKPDIASGEYFVTVRIYEWNEGVEFPGDIAANGKQLTQSDPAQMDVTGTSIDFDSLSYGKRRFVVAEIRKGKDLTSGILFTGISKLFNFEAGKHTEVNVEMSMSQTPGTDEQGFAIEIRYDDASATRVPEPAVTLRITVKNADSVIIANDLNFEKAVTEIKVSDMTKVSENTYDIAGWNITSGWTDLGDTLYTVFGKAKNRMGYESAPERADVFLDTTPPQVTSAYMTREPMFVPSVRKDGEVTQYHFSAHDPFDDTVKVKGSLVLYSSETVSAVYGAIARETTTLKEVPLAELGLTEVTATENQITVSGEITDDMELDGTYEILISLEDEVGNFAEVTDSYSKIPDILLVIRNTPPDQTAIDMSKILYIRKPWGTQDTDMVPRMSLTGTAVTTDTAISSVIAYNKLGGIIGQAELDAAASFDIASLTGGDLLDIYLNPVTFSGVKLSMPGIKVTEVEWHATMGGKEPGDIVSNPHTFFTNSIFSSTLDQDQASLQEPGSAGQLFYVESKGMSTWRQWKGGARPAPRAIHSMAYDSNRGKTVLFGGNSNSTGDDTWEWDGVNWIQINPVTKPSAREGHAMVYDSARGKVMLFGGQTDLGGGDETWEWDGINWKLLNPETKPSSRGYHAMAYDNVRGLVVMFGGVSDESGLDETWEWDGTNWTLMHPVDKPAAQAFHSMAYDSVRGKVILFSTVVFEESLSNETWEWDGTNWKKLTPAAQPSARYSYTMAFDSVRGKIILFGGINEDESKHFFDETWEWNGTNWKLLIQTVKPSPRYGHSMVYDSNRGRVVLFDGEGASGYVDDTWEFDSKTGKWIDVTPNDSKPSARSEHAMAFDSAKGKTILFGGDQGSATSDETWEWNGADWTLLEPLNKPLNRYGHGMVYESALEKILLFGGYDYTGSGFFYEGTWEWDGTDWSLVNMGDSAPEPSARYRHSMAYDSDRDIAVLFGGQGKLGGSAETWEWDGTNWELMTPESSPQELESSVMVYDEARKKTVLFGGRNFSNLSDETWEWDSINWTKMAPVTQPSARIWFAMVYDSTLERIILFGGDTSEGYNNETWAWDGAGWTQLSPAVLPTVRNNHSMAYDRENGKVVLFGGNTGGRNDETWELNDGIDDRPGHIFNVAFANSGINESDIKSMSVLFKAGATGDGTPADGVDLMVWKNDRWVIISSNDAGFAPDAIQPVTWETTDNKEIRTLLNGGKRKFNFAVVPSAPNGFLKDMGIIATDYAEVIVKYSIGE